MKPHFIRCALGHHAYTEADECNRITCERCGKRMPIRYETIPDPTLEGRQLARPKTRRQA